jgi:hypothetical protein
MRAHARAVREVLAAVTLTDVWTETGSIAFSANFVGFNTLLCGYQEYIALADLQQFLRDHASYKPVLGVTVFDQGPGDIAVFAALYEIICKLNYVLLVGRFYGTQEELGTLCILTTLTEKLCSPNGGLSRLSPGSGCPLRAGTGHGRPGRAPGWC